MKLKILFLCISVVVASIASAQSFFKPLPKGNQYASNMSLAVTDSSKLTMNAIRPVVALSALVSDGTQLAGGFGAGFEHLSWDQASQSWVTVYSISALAFLGTNGNSITATGGLVFGIPGTNGIVGVGPGYDITSKQFVLMTGVQIQFK
jgi:hypothetical protein